LINYGMEHPKDYSTQCKIIIIKNMPKNRTLVSQAGGGAPLKWSEKSPAGKLLKKFVKDGVIKEGMPPILQ